MSRARSAIGNAGSQPSPNHGHTTGLQKPLSRSRTWLYRLGCLVLIPALLLLLTEGVLRIAGYGYPTAYFLKTGTGYVSNPRFGWRFFGPALSRATVPVVLPPAKPPGTFRIFVLGSSAAQGIPNPAFSFGRILEAMLNDQFPSARFEVVNTGMTAINSHVAVTIARDCAPREGDFFIVYMGNNEVVGPFGPGTAVGSSIPSRPFIRANIWLQSARLSQALGDGLRAAGIKGKTPKAWGGMSMFLNQSVAWNHPRLASVYTHFARNLEDVYSAGTGSGAKVLVGTVLTNLRDCPPFASRHKPSLAPQDLSRWDKEFAQGKVRQGAGDFAGALSAYEAAAALDDEHAELQYRLGKCHSALARFDRAKEHLVRARDLDTLRFRADSRINQIIRESAAKRESEGIHLVDLERDISASAPQGLIGMESAYEHVHLTFEGNQAVAARLFDALKRVLPGRLTEAHPAAAAPSLARCQQLMLYTPYCRFIDVDAIAQVVTQPPFAPATGKAMTAMADRLWSELTPASLDQYAALCAQAVARRPDDLLLRGHFARLQDIRGDYASAVLEWRELLRRYPHSPNFHQGLAAALASLGKDSEAIEQFQLSLEVSPADLRTRLGLGSLYSKQGKADQAIKEYETVLSVQPNSAAAHSRLALIYDQRGDLQRALDHFTAASQAEPGNSSTETLRGNVLARLGQRDAALGAYRAALNANPEDVAAISAAAHLLMLSGKVDEGLAGLKQALGLQPYNPTVVQALAWVYATSTQDAARNGAEAVALALRAVGMGGEKPDLLDLLAAAYAENGQFDLAVDCATKAVQKARESDRPEVAAGMASRLNLYQQGKPCRIAPTK